MRQMSERKQVSIRRDTLYQRSDWHWWEYYFIFISSFARQLFAPTVNFAESWANFNWNWYFLWGNALGILDCYWEEKERIQRKDHKKKQYSREDQRHIQGSR